MAAAPIELFHNIADSESARVRRFVIESALEEQVRFRNLVYPEVEQDFRARGGKHVPALWVDGRLIEGVDAVLAHLRALRRTR